MKSVKKKFWNQVIDPTWHQVEDRVKFWVMNQVRHEVRYPIDSQVRGEVCIKVYHEIS